MWEFNSNSFSFVSIDMTFQGISSLTCKFVRFSLETVQTKKYEGITLKNVKFMLVKALTARLALEQVSEIASTFSFEKFKEVRLL